MSSNGNAIAAWQAFLGLIRFELKAHMAAVLAPLHLTPQLAHALSEIPRKGITMRALAGTLSCDASNATGIVDRLEERGFIVRRVDPDDRRVKRVFLTAAGRRMRESVEAALREPPDAIAELSAADQRALREILERALAKVERGRLDSSA
jgi:DNA-binding MarR family transcriptional regulator